MLIPVEGANSGDYLDIFFFSRYFSTNILELVKSET